MMEIWLVDYRLLPENDCGKSVVIFHRFQRRQRYSISLFRPNKNRIIFGRFSLFSTCRAGRVIVFCTITRVACLTRYFGCAIEILCVAEGIRSSAGTYRK